MAELEFLLHSLLHGRHLVAQSVSLRSVERCEISNFFPVRLDLGLDSVDVNMVPLPLAPSLLLGLRTDLLLGGSEITSEDSESDEEDPLFLLLFFGGFFIAFEVPFKPS